jgi:hypothetical protein
MHRSNGQHGESGRLVCIDLSEVNRCLMVRKRLGRDPPQAFATPELLPDDLACCRSMVVSFRWDWCWVTNWTREVAAAFKDQKTNQGQAKKMEKPETLAKTQLSA